MNGTEYAAVHSVAIGELRAFAGILAVWLMLFLKLFLLGWLSLAGACFCVRVAEHLRAKHSRQVRPAATKRRLRRPLCRWPGQKKTITAWKIISLVLLSLLPDMTLHASDSTSVMCSSMFTLRPPLNGDTRDDYQ